jgi:hypothetical protein
VLTAEPYTLRGRRDEAPHPSRAAQASGRSAWRMHAGVLVVLFAIGVAITRTDVRFLTCVAYWIAYVIHAPASSVITALGLRRVRRAWSPPLYSRVLPVLLGQFGGLLAVAATCVVGGLLAAWIP